MKIIRSIYFWLILGSVIVVVGGDALYRDYTGFTAMERITHLFSRVKAI